MRVMHHTFTPFRSALDRCNGSAILRAWAAHARVVGAAFLMLTSSVLASSAFAQGVCFTPGAPAPTGVSPQAIVTADFDGDGLPDLATANSLSNSVSVIRNLGGGSFAPQVQYGVGSEPLSLTAADFDADGDIDLAVANAVSQTISIFRNQGSGTFGAPSVRTTSGQPWYITSADVNGDGRPDLVVADYSTSSVSVYLGLGSGTFGPEVVYGAGNGPFWIACADVDGDGDLDVVVANVQGRSLSILDNQGDGTFVGHSPIPLIADPSSVAAGDMNGDGAIDLVVAMSDVPAFTDWIGVLLNPGNGAFGPVVMYPTATSPHAVHSADMNGDGFLDVVAASYGSTAVVRLNLGNGALGPQTQFAAGGSAFCLDVADLDGDGRLDIAVPALNQHRVLPLLNCGAAAGTLFCSGDGMGTACPCGNNGLDGSGCANSQFAGGSSLAAIGTASIAADTLVLKATDTPQTSVLFFQGTTQQSGGAGIVFGDGKRCAGGTLSRLGTKTAVAASAQYPEGGDPSVSVRGHVSVPGTRAYQAWYRNAASFCTSATFNLTNGYEIAWTL